MSKIKENLPYILFALLFIGIVVIEMNKPKPIDWTPTFSKDDKIPFGSYVIEDRLDDLFPGSEVKSVYQPIYNQLNEKEWKNTNYVFINSDFGIADFDYEIMLEYVANGSNVFVAASSFSFGTLPEDGDTLNVKAVRDFAYDSNITHSSDLDRITVWSQDERSFVGNNFVHCDLYSEEGFALKKEGLRKSILYSFDTARAQILGANNQGRVNFVRIPHGKGAFYFNTVPYAFTNYNILDEETDGAEYAALALSHLPNQTIWWDEYYKVGRQENQSPLRYFLGNEALRWLTYMSLAALLLFMIFEAKRKQRVIPVIKPPANTTLEFVETVSSLYLNKGDHKNLADKKIQYFFDFIRTKLYISEIDYSAEFLEQLSAKSGVEIDDVKKLFMLIRNIENKQELFEDELILLNKRIEEFYEATGIVVS